MKSSIVTGLLLAISAHPVVFAQTSTNTMGSGERPRIGLALSGGGSRGSAHIGVLRALEELRVPVDYIAGTSAGAIVGAFYAAGFSPDEIEGIIAGIGWEEAYREDVPRKDRSFRRKRDDDLFLVKSRPGFSSGELKMPIGILDGQNIELIFKHHFGAGKVPGDFDQLAIPFRAIATDLVTGGTVILKSGGLADAIRASTSIPALVAPKIAGDRLLVDGGISNNLPVDVVRSMGADIVIAVDASSQFLDREQLESVFDVTEQLSTFLTRRSTDAQIKTLTNQDILIIPELDGVTMMTFDGTRMIADRGHQAAAMHRDRLAQLAMDSEIFATRIGGLRASKTKTPVINALAIDNRSAISDRMIESRLHVALGEPLDSTTLEHDLSQIYGLDIFSLVSYEVIENDDANTLVIHATEKPRGPNYLQFGATFADDFNGKNSFNLSMAYTRTPINSRGGEWRSLVRIGEEPMLASEVYQPIDFSRRYFVLPRVEALKRAVNIFDAQGNIISQSLLSGTGFSLTAGREIGTWGTIRVSARRFHGNSRIRIGDPLAPRREFDGGEFVIRFAWDELDNLYFPTSGSWGSIEYLGSRKALGAAFGFDQISVKAGVSLPRGRNTLTLKAMFQSTLDDDAPVQNLFHLGGFGRLSGYQLGELSGQQAGLLVADYRRRIGNLNLLPMYLGASLEYGNVWQTSSAFSFDDGLWSGSVYFGLDSFFGPLYLGYGLAAGGKRNAFFYLGRAF